MPCKLSAKYANLSKHEWAKFVQVKIPDLERGELEMGSSNFRMQCLFCNLVFTGGKTRVIGHLIGDGAKCVTTCAFASEEARIWARSQKKVTIEKKIPAHGPSREIF